MDGEGLSPSLAGSSKEPGWILLCIQGPNRGHHAITQERKSWSKTGHPRRPPSPDPPVRGPQPTGNSWEGLATPAALPIFRAV